MAKGFYRNQKTICTCCGKNGLGITTYRVGHMNAPSYHCQSCFDSFANDFEKANKSLLMASSDGVELRIKNSKLNFVGFNAVMLRGVYSGQIGKTIPSDDQNFKVMLEIEPNKKIYIKNISQIKFV